MIGFYILGGFPSINSMNDVITSIQGLLFMVAPYIFLSNFKLRNILPLFKKHKKGFSVLGMLCVYFVIAILCAVINPATYCEHKWVETKKVEATCTEDGRIESHCDLCDSDRYITNGSRKGHSFEIKEETEEKIVRVCSVCGEEKIEGKKEEHKHTWEKATCEQPSICNGCGETEGEALGHTTDLGICSRCEKEIRKQSPVLFSIDSFETINGVALYIFAANRCDSLLGGCGNVMLGTASLGIVTATALLVTFLY